ncbi:hypothetical protein N7457_007143 [Penicillium paradoxum]|uniref:uncharacterized protein n=1 Tax=Penicillium paradoxum TaxID=176176 RepID=UPI0025466215|nr:uncharacterized protein N7457_007143 [Penicillium paradoxum]KAJ5779423.1 hypothetical protein N7457_007143 [Penicillium paradoxum]
MPVPTADLFDKQQNQANGTDHSGPAARTSPEQDSNDSYFRARPSSSTGASHHPEAGRALTREEADRLYEERMEEEYAKREGGA